MKYFVAGGGTLAGKKRILALNQSELSQATRRHDEWQAKIYAQYVSELKREIAETERILRKKETR